MYFTVHHLGEVENMNELVSVAVIAYNSEDYIEDTILSILSQSYTNLEVIVADDGSVDKTIEVATNIFKTQNFENYKVISDGENKGIPANCNRAIKNCSGHYIKIIAADDILLPDAIEKNVDFMKKNNSLIQYSRAKDFTKEGERVVYLPSLAKYDINFNSYDVKKQFKIISYENIIIAPTIFYNRLFFEKFKEFNEKYRLIEDYPMWIRVLYNGEKIYFMDELTVLYRKHDKSVSRNSKVVINENMFNYYCNFFKDEFEEYLKKNKNYLLLIHKRIYIYRMKKIIKHGNCRNKFFLISRLYYLLDPLFIGRVINIFKKKY